MSVLISGVSQLLDIHLPIIVVPASQCVVHYAAVLAVPLMDAETLNMAQRSALARMSVQDN